MKEVYNEEGKKIPDIYVVNGVVVDRIARSKVRATIHDKSVTPAQIDKWLSAMAYLETPYTEQEIKHENKSFYKHKR